MAREFHDACMDVVLGFPWGENLQESFYVPPHASKHVPIPPYLMSGYAGQWLRKDSRFRTGVYHHQGLALDILETGQNVCLTTKTSSGKSAVFTARILRILGQNPDATFFALYPAKALQSDQLYGLKAAFTSAGLKEEDIGVINGDIKDHQLRHDVIAKSKLVLITPDTVQSWLLANTADPTVKTFFTNLELLILDEAHVYDEVLGSHAPHLFRRLQYVADQIKRQASKKQDPPPSRGKSKGLIQILAASASLRNAPEFMKQLTGQTFVEVGAKDDGSPKSEQDVVHLAANREEELAVAKSLINKFLSMGDDVEPGTIICFVDSRKAVETLATEINARLNKDIVTPYRGSYSQTERDEINIEIRQGKRRAVICTSVLELGVDFSDVVVGICVGKPASPASLQQRLGRVGRSKKGLFIVVAPKNAFSRGKNPISLEDFCKGGSAEPTVYIDNPRILAGHALCLQKEIALLGLSQDTNLNIGRYHWTPAFLDVVAKLRAGHPIMDEDQANRYRAYRNKPHLATRLRDVDGRNLSLMASMKGDNVVNLGTVSRQQAIRECYPGAIYPHRLMRFEVSEWHRNDDPRKEPIIRLRQVDTREQTHPITQTWAFLSNEPKKLAQARSIVSTRARIAELPMSIVESVVGYDKYSPASDSTRIKSTRIYYNSKRKEDSEDDTQKPEKRYQYNIQTTGVVIDFGREHFSKDELARLARIMKDAYCSRFGVSPNNVNFCTSRIYQLRDGQKSQELDTALVLFDQNSNGLRLTRGVISGMKEIIAGMVEEPLDRELVAKFTAFYNRLAGQARAQTIKMPDEPAAKPVVDVSGIEQDLRETSILAAKSVVWHQTNGSTNNRARKSTASNTGQWVIVEGFKRVQDEIFYIISPYDDPSRPKQTNYQNGAKATHMVSRRTLFAEPPQPLSGVS